VNPNIVPAKARGPIKEKLDSRFHGMSGKGILRLFTRSSKFICLQKEKKTMNEEDVKKRTQETAGKLFGKGAKITPPYFLWKEFDRDLANDFSKFITGNLYSRTVLTLPERQMVACAILVALRATGEFKLHVNGALNVGCDPRKLAEVIFQAAPYAGMPAVNDALEVYREVLKERGEWPIK
jgi:4-carboxymuconolactone decarboxylase